MGRHAGVLPAVRATRPAVLLLSLLWILWTGTACTIERWTRTREVADNPDHEVYLEHHVFKGKVSNPGFRHPLTLTPLQVARILRSLHYTEPGFLGARGKAKPVFTNYEMLRLASSLAEALGEAGPRERVHFVSYNMEGGLVFAARQKNEGVLFVRPPGRLNLAFSFINEELPSTADRQPGIYYDYRDPVKIVTTSVRLAERPEYDLYRSEEDGTVHPLWAVFDLETLPHAAGTPPPSGKAEEAARTAGEETGKGAGGGIGKEEEERIRRKLILLKDLYEEGLLEKAEYDRIRRELLEEIKKK